MYNIQNMTIIRNLNQSKIYRLYSEADNLFYYGITCIKDIKQRLSKHKAEAKQQPRAVLSKWILDQDPKALQIEVVFEYPDCGSIEELEQHKKELLEGLDETQSATCINKMKKYSYSLPITPMKSKSKSVSSNKHELLKVKKRIDRLIERADAEEDDDSSTDSE